MLTTTHRWISHRWIVSTTTGQHVNDYCGDCKSECDKGFKSPRHDQGLLFQPTPLTSIYLSHPSRKKNRPEVQTEQNVLQTIDCPVIRISSQEMANAKSFENCGEADEQAKPLGSRTARRTARSALYGSLRWGSPECVIASFSGRDFLKAGHGAPILGDCNFGGKDAKRKP
jgi:hypothetical protein